MDSQGLATILDPFRAIFGDLGQTADLRLEHCDIATIETSETSVLCFETIQISALATEEMCAVETEDKCLLLKQNKCLLLKQDRCKIVK